MTRQSKSGHSFISKLALLISFVLSIFCTVVIVKDIVGSDGTIQLIGDTQNLAEQNKGQVEKVSKEAKNIQSKLAGKINTLQRQNQKLERALAELMQNQAGRVKWVKNSKTGHSYCLTPCPLPWHQAKNWAKQNGGHLVVVNNEAENKWLVKIFGGDTEYWIGLTDEVSEGKWFWVNGAPAQYLNWLAGEPDNYRKNQHHAAINCKSPARGLNEPGKWNDVVANDARIAIVEKK